MKAARHVSPLMASIGLLVLTACGGGDSGGGGGNAGGGAMQYAVGGVVTGLVPTFGAVSQLVVLAVNGGDQVYLNANGAFHFSKPLPAGASYVVTIDVAPVDPPETCQIGNASGTVGPGSATAVTISCTWAKFTVGGTVSGLTGQGLVLSDNGTDHLPIAASGPFTFATPVTTTHGYSVAVATQPTGETCAANKNSAGSIFGEPVTNVSVLCLPNIYNVAVTVAGLKGGTLVLGLDLTDPAGGHELPTSSLTISANGTFTFPLLLGAGDEYQVAVNSLSAAAQTCVVDDATGIVDAASVSLTVNCLAPAFAYGAGGHGNNVLAYSVDYASGALTPVPGEPFAAGDSTNAIAVTPGNHFLYATNAGTTGGPGSNTISAYTIDSGSGALTAIAGSPFATVAAPYAIAVEPGGHYAYVANFHNNTISAYAISGGTGALTPIAGGPAEPGIDGPRSLTIHPSGKFLYLTVGNEAAIWVYAIDGGTGALTALAGSPFATTIGPGPLWISPNGRYAFLANNPRAAYFRGAASSYAINSATGALSVQPAAILDDGVTALTLDPGGNFAYSISQLSSGPGTLSPLTVDIALDGAAFLFASTPAPYALLQSLSSLSTDSSGRFLYVIDANGDALAFTIDQATGNVTPAAVTPAAFSPLGPPVITAQ
jgi:6-phosphogluconolactonase (cycloisomerase 2 family)